MAIDLTSYNYSNIFSLAVNKGIHFHDTALAAESLFKQFLLEVSSVGKRMKIQREESIRGKAKDLEQSYA